MNNLTGLIERLVRCKKYLSGIRNLDLSFDLISAQTRAHLDYQTVIPRCQIRERYCVGDRAVLASCECAECNHLPVITQFQSDLCFRNRPAIRPVANQKSPACWPPRR